MVSIHHQPFPYPTGASDIGFTLARIVLRQVHVNDLARASSHLHDLLSKLLHGEFDRIAHIERSSDIILFHHQY